MKPYFYLITTLFLFYSRAYAQQTHCTITGMHMGILDGNVCLLDPVKNDTLGRCVIKKGAFEMKIDPSVKYEGIGMLCFTRFDKKAKSNAIIFVEKTAIHFFKGIDNEPYFAGSDNQLKVNNFVHSIEKLQDNTDVKNTGSQDSVKKEVSTIVNNFVKETKNTALYDFAVLTAAELLAKGVILPNLLTEAETICNNTQQNTQTLSLFCATYSEAKVAVLGTKLPPITLKNKDGVLVNFNSQRDNNKYLLIEFWASWCGPCLKKFKDMETYLSKNEKKVQVLTLSIDDSMERWNDKLKALALPYVNLYDEKEKYYKLLKGHAIPYCLIVDKNDNIIAINPDDIDKIIK